MTTPACFGRADQKSGIRPSGNGILKPENRPIPIGNVFRGNREITKLWSFMTRRKRNGIVKFGGTQTSQPYGSKMENLWMAHIGDNMMDRVIEGIEREEKANE